LKNLLDQVYDWENKTKDSTGKKEDPDYKTNKKNNTFIYFYHLKGTDIDSETSEYI